MEEKNPQEFDLEDIMREFGNGLPPEKDENIPEEESPEAEQADCSEEAIEGPEIIQQVLTVMPEPEEEAPISHEEMPEDVFRQEEETASETAEPEEEKQDTEDDKQDAEQEECLRTEAPKRVQTKLESDTIRLDDIQKNLPKAKASRAVNTDMDETRTVGISENAYGEKWEPEYEQPIGEYVPPQPIVFEPRSRLRELKKELIAGPEKRYYELSEKGFSRIQLAIFFSLIVSFAAVTATVLYASGMVQEHRMKLMVFAQFFTMLVSGLLGIQLMIDSAADLFKGRFTLNTMLTITFAACCADGIFCLQQLRVPCCAAFCLQVTMALMSSYEKRRTELSQMDTMRKANRLDGVAVCQDYYEGKAGFLRKEAKVSDFMEHHNESSPKEKILHGFALISVLVSAALSCYAGFRFGFSSGVRVLAVTLLASVPATAFITLSRPYSILETRLHSLGTVLCGWRGIRSMAVKAFFPLSHGDLYPAGSAKLNGVKFYGNLDPDRVVAYTTAVIEADGGGLVPVFQQMLENRNGYHYDALELKVYDGGIGAKVEEEAVLVGTQSFLKRMGVNVPDGIRVSYAVCTAVGGEFCGLFAMNYEKVRSSSVGVATLCKYHGLTPVVTSTDFVISSLFMKAKFGVIAKKVLLPEYEVRQTLGEKVLEEDAVPGVIVTRPGLAPAAFGVTGARALETAGKIGVVIHMLGGIMGLAMMAVLVFLGSLELMTPANMFLYQLVWMVPGFLITEWTRSV